MKNKSGIRQNGVAKSRLNFHITKLRLCVEEFKFFHDYKAELEFQKLPKFVEKDRDIDFGL